METFPAERHFIMFLAVVLVHLETGGCDIESALVWVARKGYLSLLSTCGILQSLPPVLGVP